MKPTGIIQSVSGVVKAVALDGTERILNVGDVVELNEQVITGASGAVVIALSDGTTMKIGHDETVTLNADTSPTEAQSDVAEIQAALQTDPNFDPSDLPATAAGNPAAGGAGNSGSSFVEVEHLEPEAEVTSGFETKGIEQQFNEGSEDDGIIDSVPTAGTITVMLDEDDLAVAEFDDAHYEVLELAFETATGLDAQRASSEGANDEALGDDLTPPSPTVLSGALVADFGADGPGDIVFNLAGTQPTGLSSAGEALQYHVSADGHSLIAYILTEEAIDGDGPVSTVAEIIFSAEITDVDAGLFRVELYGPLDHPDGSTEDNLLIDLGFTISDVDGDTASGVLRLDIDDDSPVIETMEEHFDGFTGEIDSDEIESLSTARVDEDDIDPEGNGDNQAGDDDGFPGAILPINFGADGPAADNAVVLNAEGIVDQNGNALTSNGVELEYTWDSVTDSLTGRANGEEVMTLSVGMIDDADEEFVVLYVDLYGNLDHPDGSTEDNLIIDVSYTATDSDGDSVVGSFNVDIDDDSPVIITPENSSVDEEGLDGNLGNSYEDGGDLAGEEVTASGSLGIQWGADDNNDGGSFDRSATFDDQDAPEGLSSNGLAISYLISEDGLTLTGYTGDDASVEASWVFTVALSDLESGSYSFELLGNLDHGVANTEDDIDLSFAFTATDSDGDTASSSFTLTVDDDAAILVSATDDLLADEDSLENANEDAERAGEVTAATVLTGNLADNFNFGADGAAAQAIYSVNGELADEGDITITGMNYELVIDAASGDYTFTLTDNILDSVEGGDVENLVDDAIQAVLEVVVEDADGDRIEGTVTLNVDVQDDIPVIILGESTDSAAEFTIDNHDEVSSAGYHNSYGYYVRTLDADGNVLSGEPTVGVIIENDAHAEHGGFAEPVTVTGYSQEQIGYFIIPNGGGLNSGLDGGEVVSFAEVGGQWQAFTADGSAIMGAGSAVLFDVSALNSDGKDHMQGDELVGDQNWEDLQIPGDDGDYNDLYVNVEWTGVTVSGDVVEEVSFGADGEGSIDFSLDEGDINIEGVLESNGHEVMFKAVDSTDDGHNDQIIGYTAEDGDVLIIDHVLEGAYEVSILGPIDDVEGETHADVDITAHVAVTDGDGDMAYADLAIHIDIDMHQVLATPAALD